MPPTCHEPIRGLKWPERRAKKAGIRRRGSLAAWSADLPFRVSRREKRKVGVKTRDGLS